MATLVKTFSFAVGAEGLVEVGDTAGISFGFIGADGDPASGCVRFLTSTQPLVALERARQASSTTWETLGVPAGATVTDVQVTAWKYKVIFAQAPVTSHTAQIDVVGAAAASVVSGSPLVSQSLPTATGSWTAGNAGASKAVLAGSQASTSVARLQLQYAVNIGSGGELDTAIDTVELTITYTPGGASASSAGAGGGVSESSATHLATSTGLAAGGGLANSEATRFATATFTAMGGGLASCSAAKSTTANNEAPGGGMPAASAPPPFTVSSFAMGGGLATSQATRVALSSAVAMSGGVAAAAGSRSTTSTSTAVGGVSAASASAKTVTASSVAVGGGLSINFATSLPLAVLVRLLAPQTAIPMGTPHLLTTDTRRLERRGYIPTRPAGAVVYATLGPPQDALLPPGTTVALDRTASRLYRRVEGVWRPVASDADDINAEGWSPAAWQLEVV